jgi:hypothetical protein
MKESTIYKRIKDTFFEAGILCQRIESGSTASGIPDMFIQCPFFNAWVELKQVTPKKDIFSMPWRPGQMAWIKKYKAFGSNFALICAINDVIYFTLEVKQKYIVEDFYKFDIDFFYRAMLREQKRQNKREVSNV